MRNQTIVAKLTAMTLAASLVVLAPGVESYRLFAQPVSVGAASGISPAWGGVMGSFAGPLQSATAARFGANADAPLYHFAKTDFSSRQGRFMAEPVYRALEASGVTVEAFKNADEKQKAQWVEAAVAAATEEQYQQADSMLERTRKAAEEGTDLKSLNSGLAQLQERGSLYLDAEYHEQVILAKEAVQKRILEASKTKTTDAVMEKALRLTGKGKSDVRNGIFGNNPGPNEERWKKEKAALDRQEMDAKNRFMDSLSRGNLRQAEELVYSMATTYDIKVRKGMTNLSAETAKVYLAMLVNIAAKSRGSDNDYVKNQYLANLREFFIEQHNEMPENALREYAEQLAAFDVTDEGNAEEPGTEAELRMLIDSALKRGDKTEAFHLQERLESLQRKDPTKTSTGAPRKKVTFADVAGQEEAKAELQRVVKYMKNPEKYRKLGAKGYKGVLLIGPPGTGKTLIARAVAGETGATYLEKSGSDFVEIWVGNGAKKARALFTEANEAAKKGPVILFIDELDAVGKARSSGPDSGGNQEHDQTLNELLVQINDLHPNVVLMGATNRADTLDPALVRGGRFELKVPVGLPDVVGREGIFKVHTRNKPMAKDVDLAKAARETPGLSGADIEAVANDAAMIAAERDAEDISMKDIAAAIDRQGMGHERRLVMSEQERRIVAYHESGHALVSHLMPNADPVRKVTIIPHGLHALGLMQAMPQEEKTLYSRSWLVDRMAVALGGRAAEKLMMNETYSGAQSDLEAATRIANAMVTQYGMSDKVGPVTYDGRGQVSQARQRLIDAEVQKLVEEAQTRATEVLTTNKAALQKMADILMEKETLRGEEIEALVPSNKKASAANGAKALLTAGLVVAGSLVATGQAHAAEVVSNAATTVSGFHWGPLLVTFGVAIVAAVYNAYRTRKAAAPAAAPAPIGDVELGTLAGLEALSGSRHSVEQWRYVSYAVVSEDEAGLGAATINGQPAADSQLEYLHTARKTPEGRWRHDYSFLAIGATPVGDYAVAFPVVAFTVAVTPLVAEPHRDRSRDEELDIPFSSSVRGINRKALASHFRYMTPRLREYERYLAADPVLSGEARDAQQRELDRLYGIFKDAASGKIVGLDVALAKILTCESGIMDRYFEYLSQDPSTGKTYLELSKEQEASYRKVMWELLSSAQELRS